MSKVVWHRPCRKWKSEAGGKRRIHGKPRQEEVEACRPWLERELGLIQPQVIVCWGRLSRTRCWGRRVTIASARGRAWASRHDMPAFVTVHPSAILRIREHADREAEMRRFVDNLERAEQAARQSPRRPRIGVAVSDDRGAGEESLG